MEFSYYLVNKIERMSLFKNTVIYTIGRMLPQVAGFILLPLYTKYLTPKEYGIVEAMITLGVVMSIFFSMATERSLFRLYYDYSQEEMKKKMVGNTVLLIFGSSTIILILVFLLSPYISMIYSDIEFNPYFVYAIITAYFTALAFIPQTLYQVQENALGFFIITALSFFVGIAFILYFLVIEKEGVIGLLKGKMIASIVMIPIYIYIINKNALLKLDMGMIKNILAFSLPMLPALLTSWVMNMSNRVFIEQYFTLEEVGLFSIAFKINNVATILLGALFTAYNPMFYRLANQKNQEQAKAEIKKLNNLFAILILLVCFVIALFSEEIVSAFLNVRYLASARYIPIMLFSTVLIQITGVYNLMIYQYKKSNVIMMIYIFTAIISVVLNFLVVPKYSSFGAAWVTVITSTVILILTVFYAKKSYYIPLQKNFIILSLLMGGGVLVFDYFIDKSMIYLVLKIIFILGIIFYLYNKKIKNIREYL